MSPSQYPALLAYLPSVSRRGSTIPRLNRGKFSHFQHNDYIAPLTPPFPATFTDLVRSQNTLQALSFSSELQWMSVRLTLYAPRINRYLATKLDIEQAVLSGRLADALARLDDLEEDSGKSFFSIECRLALLQTHKGLESQKRFLKQIHATVTGGVTPFTAYYLSQKVELATNPLAFPSRFVSILNRIELHAELHDYLLYRVLRHAPTKELWPSILTWEQNASLIDQYETVLLALQSSLNDPNEIQPALGILRASISDHRLERIAAFVGSAAPVLSEDNSTPTLLEQLDADESGSALDLLLSNDRLVQAAHSIPLESLCRADASRPKHGSLIHGSRAFLVEALRMLLAKDGTYEDVLLDLLRVLDAYPSFDFTKLVRPLALRAATDLLTPEDEELRRAFVADRFFSPEYLKILPDTVRQEIATRLPTLSNDLSQADLGWNSVKSARVRNDKLRLQLNALLERDELDTAFVAIVDAYIRQPLIVRMLPIRRAVSLASDARLSSMKDVLSIAIVFDLYLRNIGDERRYVREDAYEDVLALHHCQRPSELKLGTTANTGSSMMYFLRFICTPEIMHSSAEFRSSKELQEERLKVLELLRTQDPVNAAAYETEVRDITREQVVQQGLLHVERSKFAINTQPLRRWAEKNIKESFLRSRDLIAAGQMNVQHNTGEVAEILSIPINEVKEINREALTRFLEEAYSNSFYGLDSYLSMRARHGSFSGHVRAVFEEEQIVTSRNGKTGDYKRNESWLQSIPADSHTLDAIDDELRTFARRFDHIVKRFSDDKLQVLSRDKSHGLFTFSITDLDSVLLAQATVPPSSYDRYVSECLSVFWDNVGTSTKHVRAALDGELKPDLDRVSAELLASLQKFRAVGAELEDLINAVRRAKTNLHLCFDTLREWFQVPNALPDRVYTMDEVIDISLKQVKKLHPEFEPNVTRTVNYPLGILELPRFSDIFFIIFENIQRHAGVGDAPDVCIRAAHENGRLELAVDNQIESWEGIEERLQLLRGIIAEGKFQTVVSSEGGTGLVKLWNTINTGAATLQFYAAHDRFSVELSIPVIEISGDESYESDNTSS